MHTQKEIYFPTKNENYMYCTVGAIHHLNNSCKYLSESLILEYSNNYMKIINIEMEKR